MLRRMLTLFAVVSLLSLAACGNDVTGVTDIDAEPERGADRFHNEIAPKAELSEPEEGGGGGGGSEQRPNAAENQRRRGTEEIAP